VRVMESLPKPHGEPREFLMRVMYRNASRGCNRHEAVALAQRASQGFAKDA